MKQRRGSVKKITAMLLSLAMVATAVQLPASARAEAASTTCTVGGCGGTYTNGFCSKVTTHYEAPELNAEGYYEIGNAGELYWFAAHVNAGNLTSNAILTADIVVNNGTMTENITGVRAWVPICVNPRGPGEENKLNYLQGGYAGTFDGKGHSIAGLYYKDTTKCYAGLFSGVTRGSIKNVGVINSYIHSDRMSGAIVGYSNGGEIVGCYNSNSTIRAVDYIGGIVGYADDLMVKNCWNSGTVTGKYHVGGIAGGINSWSSYGTYYCYNTGTITATTAGVGGIIGYCNTNVIGSYNTGTVKGNATNFELQGQKYTTSAAGAIVGFDGRSEDALTAIQNCYYLSGSAKNSAGQSTKGIGADWDNLGGIDKAGATTAFSSVSDLATGAICYGLNGGVTDGTQGFYQTVGSGTPAFSGQTVYYGYKDCNATQAVYSNTSLKTTQGHEYSATCDTSCNVCSYTRTTQAAHTVKSTLVGSTTLKGVCSACGKDLGSVTIVAPTGDSTYNGTARKATLSGSIEGVNLQITYNTANGTPPIDVGSYTASVTVAGKTAKVEYAINKAKADLGTVTADDVFDTLDVSAVNLQSTKHPVQGSLSLASSKLYYGTRSYTWSFSPYIVNGKDNYKITQGSVTITVKDTIAPYATYQIGSGTAKRFGTTQQDGVVSKNTQTIQFFFYDQNASGENGSGIKSKQYYLSNTWVEDMTSITEWKSCPSTLTLTAPRQYYIYVKVTDNQDNVFLGVSERNVIYKDSTVSPAVQNYTYKEGRALSVNLTLNGNTVKEVKDAQGVTLSGEHYTVNGSVLTLKASYLNTLNKGTYTYTVAMNPQGVTAENVTSVCTFTIIVKPAQLSVERATVSNRIYDGTDVVEVLYVKLQGVRGSDNVAVNLSGVTGRISGTDAGSYDRVTLSGLTLTGTAKNNYTLATTATVSTAVAIAKMSGHSVEDIDRQYLYLRENSDSIDLFGLLPLGGDRVVYGEPEVSGNISFAEAPAIAGNCLTYTVGIGEVGDTATISIPVSMPNHVDFTITINLVLSDQKQTFLQDSSVALLQSDTLTYGESLGNLHFNDVIFVDEEGTVVPGTLGWRNADYVPTADEQSAGWVFTPDSIDYYPLTGTVEITVNKATPYIADLPVVGEIIYGETLGQSTLSGGEAWHSESEELSVAGVFSWKDSTISPKMSDSDLTNYAVAFTPEDTVNYNTVYTFMTVRVNKKVGEYTGLVERQYLYLRENGDSIDLTELLPVDCGEVEYGMPEWEGVLTYKQSPVVSSGALCYTLNAGECNGTGTITVPVTMENCQDITITVSILLHDQKRVTLQGSLLQFNTLTYGESVSELPFGDATFVDEAGNTVPGTLAWVNPIYIPDAGEQSTGWVFTPDSIDYYPLTGTVEITVNKATPYIADLPVAGEIIYGEVLGQSILSGGEAWHSESEERIVAGTFSWKANDISPKMSDSGLTGYAVIFTPADTANYNAVETTVTINVNKKAGEYTDFVSREYLYLTENSDYIDLTELLPAGCGAVEYGMPEWEGVLTYKQSPVVSNGALSYTLNAGECNGAGTITVPVTMENCQDIEIVISILLYDQKRVTLQGSLLQFNTLTYGESVSVLPFGDVTFVDETGNTVAGNLAWVNPGYVPDAGEQYADWVFTPNSIEYYPFAGSVKIIVTSVSQGGDEPTEPAEPVNPCTHGETEVRNSAAPGCTSYGYTGDVCCTLCGTVVESGSLIYARGHLVAGYMTKQPTTEEEGEYRHECINCDYYYLEVLEKLPVVEPTPGVAGAEGKTGWNAILRELKTVEEGDVFTIDMGGTTVVPKKVLRRLYGKDITVVFLVTEEISLRINAKDVPERITKELDLGVLLDLPFEPEEGEPGTKIPQELLRELTQGKWSKYVTLRLTQEGELVPVMSLSTTVGKKYKGFVVRLYYYNEEEELLELVQTGMVGEDGTAEFTFTCGGDYVAVFTLR